MDLLTIEHSKKTILQHGFYHQQDLITGKQVDDISEKGFPFKTEEGLDLCKANTFNNEVSCAPIYETKTDPTVSAFVLSLNQCSLGAASAVTKS